MSEIIPAINRGVNAVVNGVDRFVFNGDTRNRLCNTLPGKSDAAMIAKQVVLAPLLFAYPEPFKVGMNIQDGNGMTSAAYAGASAANINTLIKWVEVGAHVAPVAMEKVLALLHVDPNIAAPAAIGLVGALVMGAAIRGAMNVQQNLTDSMFHGNGNDFFHAGAIAGVSGGATAASNSWADGVGTAIVNAVNAIP